MISGLLALALMWVSFAVLLGAIMLGFHEVVPYGIVATLVCLAWFLVVYRRATR